MTYIYYIYTVDKSLKSGKALIFNHSIAPRFLSSDLYDYSNSKYIPVYSMLFQVYIVSVDHAGGGLFGIFGKYTNRFGKDPIVLLGLLVHFSTFLLIYYNLPVESTLHKVPADLSLGQIFNPSKYVLCSVITIVSCP